MCQEKTTMQFRIDADLKKEFDAACDALSINKSNLIRKWIVEWLEKQKKSGEQSQYEKES